MINILFGGHDTNSTCMTTPKRKNSRDRKVFGKRFLKPFQFQTKENKNSYLLYKKAEGVSWLNAKNDGLSLNTSWVVPYNSYFLRNYNCHINFEVSKTIDKVKYLVKYVYKDIDRATVAFEDRNNKIKCYLSSQYIGPMEAVWYIIGFQGYAKSPLVTWLHIHKKNRQSFYFLDNAIAEK